LRDIRRKLFKSGILIGTEPLERRKIKNKVKKTHKDETDFFSQSNAEMSIGHTREGKGN
jgi:hypothetical protein